MLMVNCCPGHGVDKTHRILLKFPCDLGKLCTCSHQARCMFHSSGIKALHHYSINWQPSTSCLAAEAAVKMGSEEVERVSFSAEQADSRANPGPFDPSRTPKI